METLAKLLNKLKTLDRRIIFTLTALAVIIPLVARLGIPSKQITNEVQGLYDYLDKLPPGSKVLISFDYDPQTKPECHPMAIAIVRHCFKKNLIIISIALWPTGASLADQVLTDEAKILGKEAGKDYAFLGYKPGGAVVIQKICTNFAEAFPTDDKGTPLKDISVMSGINDLTPFSAILSLSSGDPGIKQWVMIAHEQTRVPVAGGCTAVSAPEFYPYLNSGQMFGLLGGMKGASEYEQISGFKGMATAGMGAQSIVHLLLIIFIILANISYFYEKRKEKLGI
ncbi:MAG TPA: hypothetical protein PL110_21580, partial [Candidatus Eremiobacteraeota bacterium]|nr:hypothetical protein [Candidatus Eremiobacteraeota bacterium]